jgi:fatty-acyl-CoA synthase
MDDLCMLPHTSGTTGAPKGIMLTHANLTWNVVNLLSCVDFRADDVTIAIAPFFRVGGTGVNVLPVLFLGGTVIVPEDPAPDELLQLMQRHRVTVGFGNPDGLDALVRSPLWPSVDLSSIRFVLTGGAPVPERLIRTYGERGVALVQGYGLSEAAPFVMVLDPARARDKIGAAGRPAMFVDVRIVDPDGGDAKPGATGELLVRGPNVMAGYWNRPDDTRRVLSADGWLRTGDAARRDDDGDLWIVGRVADRFVSAGLPVDPGDVERVLLDHPAIADAGVTVLPASFDGGSDAVVALVVLSEPGAAAEQDVLAFGRARLATHQAPTAVRFVDRLPRTSVGKLIRSDLRPLAASLPPP